MEFRGPALIRYYPIILFLDIDGVLNSEASAVYWNRLGKDNGGLSKHDPDFCPISCSNFISLIETFPEMKIVVSSTWRIGETIESMAALLQKAVNIPTDRIVGLTPRISGAKRGIEIQMWMESYLQKLRVTHVIEKEPDIVILDDDSDMEHLKPRLVKTSWRDGFTRLKMQEVIDMLRYPWRSIAPYYAAKLIEEKHLTMIHHLDCVYYGPSDEKVQDPTTVENWAYIKWMREESAGVFQNVNWRPEDATAG